MKLPIAALAGLAGLALVSPAFAQAPKHPRKPSSGSHGVHHYSPNKARPPRAPKHPKGQQLSVLSSAGAPLNPADYVAMVAIYGDTVPTIPTITICNTSGEDISIDIIPTLDDNGGDGPTIFWGTQSPTLAGHLDDQPMQCGAWAVSAQTYDVWLVDGSQTTDALDREVTVQPGAYTPGIAIAYSVIWRP